MRGTGQVYRSEVTDDGIIRRGFTLKTDLPNLEAIIDTIGGAALIVVDPVSAYLGGGVDSHRNATVRAVLSPRLRRISVKRTPRSGTS